MENAQGPLGVLEDGFLYVGGGLVTNLTHALV
jgi:hypothetical protein